MIQFESLPNELLLNLFEYFKTIELFQIFYGLNSRFNILLYNYYRNYHLDFRFISKRDFLIFSDHHLPQIINHIVSLRIGDEYETPGLPYIFHFLGYSLREFIHLQYLSLHDIELSIFIEYFNDISQLNNLISLTITNCNISFYETKEMNFFNQIWLLPKLKYFHINTDYLKYINNFQINHHSSTLEHIYIHTSCEFSYYNLINIIEYTSNLQYISMSIEALNKYEMLTFNLSSIINLKLKYRGETNILKNLLQNTPNLQELHIRMMNTYLTGHEWKEIIKNYLPCLKILNFQICIRYLPNENVKIPYDEFLNTFRTSFWLDEHQWYICSDKYPDEYSIQNQQIDLINQQLQRLFQEYQNLWTYSN
ncbi:hypothetical protein I4U23_005977 [Adineta vaga]|nr:hypothetical protein I4U23_005977 [Adineta vaga]